MEILLVWRSSIHSLSPLRLGTDFSGLVDIIDISSQTGLHNLTRWGKVWITPLKFMAIFNLVTDV
jgi:hypothetical protein